MKMPTKAELNTLSIKQLFRLSAMAQDVGCEKAQKEEESEQRQEDARSKP